MIINYFLYKDFTLGIFLKIFRNISPTYYFNKVIFLYYYPPGFFGFNSVIICFHYN